MGQTNISLTPIMAGLDFDQILFLKRFQAACQSGAVHRHFFRQLFNRYGRLHLNFD
jgi:hypothetical protein